MEGEHSFGEQEDEVYGEMLDVLNDAGVGYMIGGTAALHAYTGIWRDTKDLDLLAPAENVRPTLSTLSAAGFETEITDPCWLSKAWRGDPFADIVHANQNGLVPVEKDWLSRAKKGEVLGRSALVVPVEELVLSKIFVAFRDHYDGGDVLHLIFATKGDLDWERILGVLGEHWELLLAYLHLFRYVYPSHAHYLPPNVLEDLQDRHEKRAGTAEAGEEPPRFRGMVIDHFSFTWDVNQWGLPDERAANREAAHWCLDDAERADGDAEEEGV